MIDQVAQLPGADILQLGLQPEQGRCHSALALNVTQHSGRQGTDLTTFVDGQMQRVLIQKTARVELQRHELHINAMAIQLLDQPLYNPALEKGMAFSDPAGSVLRDTNMLDLRTIKPPQASGPKKLDVSFFEQNRCA